MGFGHDGYDTEWDCIGRSVSHTRFRSFPQHPSSAPQAAEPPTGLMRVTTVVQSGSCFWRVRGMRSQLLNSSTLPFARMVLQNREKGSGGLVASKKIISSES